MTDKTTHHPRPGRPEPSRGASAPFRTTATRCGFDPAFLGPKGQGGPKGPKGRPIPLPGKSRGR